MDLWNFLDFILYEFNAFGDVIPFLGRLKDKYKALEERENIKFRVKKNMESQNLKRNLFNMKRFEIA